MADVFQGGFLAGKKTYIIGTLAILTALGKYLTGDLSLASFITELPLLLEGAGIQALRAGIAKEK